MIDSATEDIATIIYCIPSVPPSRAEDTTPTPTAVLHKSRTNKKGIPSRIQHAHQHSPIHSLFHHELCILANKGNEAAPSAIPSVIPVSVARVENDDYGICVHNSH